MSGLVGVDYMQQSCKQELGHKEISTQSNGGCSLGNDDVVAGPEEAAVDKVAAAEDEGPGHTGRGVVSVGGARDLEQDSHSDKNIEAGPEPGVASGEVSADSTEAWRLPEVGDGLATHESRLPALDVTACVADDVVCVEGEGLGSPLEHEEVGVGKTAHVAAVPELGTLEDGTNCEGSTVQSTKEIEESSEGSEIGTAPKGLEKDLETVCAGLQAGVVSLGLDGMGHESEEANNASLSSPSASSGILSKANKQNSELSTEKLDGFEHPGVVKEVDSNRKLPLQDRPPITVPQIIYQPQAREEVEIASSEDEFRGRNGVDKEADSSMDSTANSASKPNAREARALLEEVQSSSSEESANSRPPSRPSVPDQPKKRIDLRHQFVREIVKIQQDREQFEKQVQSEKQNQLSGLAQDVRTLKGYGRRQEKKPVDVLSSQGRPYTDRQPEPAVHARDVERKVTFVESKARVSLPSHRGKEAEDGNFRVNSKELWKDDVQDRTERGRPQSGRSQRFKPIYRPPNARDAPVSNDEGEAVADTDSVHYGQHEQVVSFISQLPNSRGGAEHLPAKDWKEKGSAVRTSVSPVKRLVHCVDPRALEDETEGLGIRITLDTARHQRLIEYLDPAANTEASKFIITIPGSGASFKDAELRGRGSSRVPKHENLVVGPEISHRVVDQPPGHSSFQFSAKYEDNALEVSGEKGKGSERGRSRRSAHGKARRRESAASQVGSGKVSQSGATTRGFQQRVEIEAGVSEQKEEITSLKPVVDTAAAAQDRSKGSPHEAATRAATKPAIEHPSPVTRELPGPFPRISERWGDVVEDAQEATRSSPEVKVPIRSPINSSSKWGNEPDIHVRGEAPISQTSKRGRVKGAASYTPADSGGPSVNSAKTRTGSSNLGDHERIPTRTVYVPSAVSKKADIGRHGRQASGDVQGSGRMLKKTVWERLGPQKSGEPGRARIQDEDVKGGGRAAGPVQFSSQDWRRYKDPSKDSIAALPHEEGKEGLSSGHGSNAESDFSHVSEESGEVSHQVFKYSKQKRSKFELYVPRRGSSVS